MTALAKLLRERIEQTGPIRVAEYMGDCLMHPAHGYYATRNPLGQDGDFITGPEISQMFGELIGLALAQSWVDQGQAAQFILAELGPGRGTLMADILRAASKMPGFRDAAQVHFVETSPVLRDAQAALVPDAQWHDTIDGLPAGPLFLVANEFFDALPIRQFIKDGNGWRERMVGIRDGGFAFGLSANASLAMLKHRLADTKDGDLVEFCPALPGIVQAIGQQIDRDGGCALIIDYGDWQSQGDTLQAVTGHRSSDPLQGQGESDLTAHVDFAEIASHAAPAKFTRLTPQGVFLERLGITARAQALAKTLSGTALDTHIAAHRRLTNPDEMGDLFKVIGLYPATAVPPAGLEP